MTSMMTTTATHMARPRSAPGARDAPRPIRAHGQQSCRRERAGGHHPIRPTMAALATVGAPTLPEEATHGGA